jgi:hypothetical protein
MKKYLFILSCIVFTGICNSCTKDEHNLFATLYGIVSDAVTSDPVSGATVTLSPGGKSQTTGDDGRYEFTNLDAAQYTVTIQKTGYKTNRKTVTAVATEKTEANIPLTKE